MTKNILNNDVVHHVRNMMTAWLKIPLPTVAFSSFFGVSRLLRDEPHRFASRSGQKKLRQDIKLNPIFIG